MAGTALLDAGDYNQGTPYFTVFKGDLEMELMNALGYEVVAIGNHEFDNGVNEFARRLSKAEFQTVCANYDFSGTALEPYVKPYTIVYKNGRKIGVFGLLANIKSLVAKQNREGLVYIDAYEAAQRWADYLKNEEHCDLVIALSHLGYSGSHGHQPGQEHPQHRRHHRRPQSHIPEIREDLPQYRR